MLNKDAKKNVHVPIYLFVKSITFFAAARKTKVMKKLYDCYNNNDGNDNTMITVEQGDITINIINYYQIKQKKNTILLRLYNY